MKLIYLQELWQEWEEGCKSIFKEMEVISKETEIIKIRTYYVFVLNIGIKSPFF